MAFEFRKKTILIISPQPFEGLYVSKQHYAIELAKRGNLVYFMEPPVSNGKPFVQLEALPRHPSITLVRYKPFFNSNIRFHFRSLFNLLMRLQVRRINRILNCEIDIVWSFETNLFSDFSWFNSKKIIYHVVDPINYKHQWESANSADIIICVSMRILSSFSKLNVPKYFINHGIAGPYFELAQKILACGIKQSATAKIKVGYIGNLLRGPVNSSILKQIIAENSNVQFHFWGNDKVHDEATNTSRTFIQFLRNQQNVFLHGLKTPDELVTAIRDMDAFVLSYMFIAGESDQSNSHKVLEYLSTGKVVISSFVETYKEMEPLICMTGENKDHEFPTLFNSIIHKLDYYNDPKYQRERIKLTLDNNYTNHIDRIENLVSNL
jgi:glycosyltransferase involved in cell wall biosynthesis